MNWKWIKYCLKRTWRGFKFASPAIISVFLLVILVIVSWQVLGFTVVELVSGRVALSNGLSFLSYFAILFTFIAILWNTLETGKLKEIQKKQIRMQIKPVLIFRYRGNGNLFIENIGNGVAKNIHINCINLVSSLAKGFLVCNVDEDVLKKDQECEVNIEPAFKTRSFERVPFRWEYFEKGTTFLIEYEDIEGTKYETKIGIASRKFIIEDIVEL